MSRRDEWQELSSEERKQLCTKFRNHLDQVIRDHERCAGVQSHSCSALNDQMEAIKKNLQRCPEDLKKQREAPAPRSASPPGRIVPNRERGERGNTSIKSSDAGVRMRSLRAGRTSTNPKKSRPSGNSPPVVVPEWLSKDTGSGASVRETSQPSRSSSPQLPQWLKDAEKDLNEMGPPSAPSHKIEQVVVAKSGGGAGGDGQGTGGDGQGTGGSTSSVASLPHRSPTAHSNPNTLSQKESSYHDGTGSSILGRREGQSCSIQDALYHRTCVRRNQENGHAPVSADSDDPKSWTTARCRNMQFDGARKMWVGKCAFFGRTF